MTAGTGSKLSADLLGTGGEFVERRASALLMREAEHNPVEAVDNGYLLREYGKLRAEVKKLRRENRELRKQRDRWREEARNWKWGALKR